MTAAPDPVVHDAAVAAPRKLIEVALPLDAINAASAKEKSIRHGHPSTLHLWWARRPLAAARAVIFAQMVDDPSAHPDLFPTEAAQQRERSRLFAIIEDLVLWKNTINEEVLERARAEIWASWRRACAANADHPRADELFDRHRLPPFCDPFAGGGSLPLEAQRLGLEAHASDLNPVAVLINKAMIEIPPRFAARPSVNPAARCDNRLTDQTWVGAQGLADDIRHYGQQMRDEAARRIGHLYPKATVSEEMSVERPDLAPYVGRELTVVAWLWARTVPSPNPAFADVEVPLASTFVLSKKKGKEAYVEPMIERGDYRFEVKSGDPPSAARKGTKSAGSRSSFECLMSVTPLSFEYLRSEARAGRMGARLMAIVAEGDRSRVYLSPTEAHQSIAESASPFDPPSTRLPEKALGFRVQQYGMTTWKDLFTARQLVALTTFSDLVGETREQVRGDAIAAGMSDDGMPLRDGGTGATAYAEAVSVYLAFALTKMADRGSSICTWYTDRDSTRNTFSRQAIPMTWDFAELNTLLDGTGSFAGAVEWTAESIEGSALRVTEAAGVAQQADAAADLAGAHVFSTDPPYFDNIGYADLSDFFYVWLRRSLRSVYPELLATVAVPKAEELVATQHRHASQSAAEQFFLDGMTRTMCHLADSTQAGMPLTIYYAFKQSEKTAEGGEASTGWETFLDAVLRAGLSITGTWPIRTELTNRSVGMGANALATSIVLVCRPRAADAPTATRQELQAALRAEFPAAVTELQRANIAPVDLAQASIGPGMAVFSRYREVLNADGSGVTMREALALINATLDEVLAEQEGDFDADTRWAVTWFEQYGYDEADYGLAEQLSKAKNTSVDGLVESGAVVSSRGQVRLLRPAELPPDWDPAIDLRRIVWETAQHLIRVLETGGEQAAAALVAELGAEAEVARDLAYRLYLVSERRGRAADARMYNGLVQSWPEIARLAQQAPSVAAAQSQMFEMAGPDDPA